MEQQIHVSPSPVLSLSKIKKKKKTKVGAVSGKPEHTGFLEEVTSELFPKQLRESMIPGRREVGEEVEARGRGHVQAAAGRLVQGN